MEAGPHSAVLRDEVFNVVPGTVNVTQGRAWVDLNEEGVKYKSQRLPKAPHTPMAGKDVPSVTFKEAVSSTPCVRLNPAAVNLLGVSSPETSDKETEDKDFRHYQPQVKVMKEGQGQKLFTLYHEQEEKSTVAHSLQLATVDFKKIREPKISKVKGGYLSDVMLVFNSWPNDIEMCIQERRLTNLEAVQLIKDYTSDNVRGAVEFFI